MLFTEDGICGRGFMIYTWGNYICAIEFHGSIAITFFVVVLKKEYVNFSSFAC